MASLFSFPVINSVRGYFSDHDIKENIFEAGHPVIEIVENGDLPAQIAPYTESVFGYGAEVANTGPSSCYVRVSVTFYSNSLEEVCTLGGLASDEGWETCYADSEGDGALYGYYYYRYPIEAGDSSPELFDGVYVSDSVNEDDAVNFEINVYAEAVASDGSMSFEEAWEEVLQKGR